MENRNGLAVDVESTLATGKGEREAATVMARRSLKRGAPWGAGGATGNLCLPLLKTGAWEGRYSRGRGWGCRLPIFTWLSIRLF